MHRAVRSMVVVAGVGAGVVAARRDATRQGGDAVEGRVRPAPGGRGTELAARLRQGAPSGPAGALARVSGSDPRQELRAALRQSRQLLETGEVLSPDSPPTTRRT